MTDNLPEKFVRLMSECHGAKGKDWLARLPQIIGEIETDLAIKVGAPFENLSYHFVAPCFSENYGKAVLKIGFPEENSPVFNEAEMLKLYDGRGAVKLLYLDEKRRALLLERLKPGKSLKSIFAGNEEKTVKIGVEVLREIKRKPPPKHNFVLLENWFAGLQKAENTEFPAAARTKARNFYEELSSAETFLLHGDFHHENILSADRESFLVIDPKGIVGQIGYEISVFLNNHAWIAATREDLQKHSDFAVKKFAEAFEIEPQDLHKWAYAQAVLSAWWTFEENGKNWKSDLALADVWKV